MENGSSNCPNIYSKEFPELNLIVNADDLGICQERDEGIFELFEKKVISSASMIVNGHSFESSVNTAKKIMLPLGLHINLTEGEPANKSNLETCTLATLNKETKTYQMFGKFGFREKLIRKEIDPNDIKNEVIAQFLQFIKQYNSIPDHFDGHQHIHIIPEVAEIIADVASNYFGVYFTRIPNESLPCVEKYVQDEGRLRFYKEIVEHSQKSREIYLKHQIVCPDGFVGMSIMGNCCNLESMKFTFDQTFHSLKELNKPIFVEYMCHPGYPGSNWDDFNRSQDRLKEKITIEEFFSNNPYHIVPFSKILRRDQHFSILIIGDFTYGTGNLISARRLKLIFNKLGYPSYLFNSKYLNYDKTTKELDLSPIIEFIKNQRINLIIGINLWRAGRIVHSLLNKTNIGKHIDLKFYMILAGTDANVFINDPDKKELMKFVLERAEKIISFNQEMIDRIKEKVGNIFDFTIIPQSVSICFSKCSFRERHNISSEFKISLMPSSIRAVKDPTFIIREIINILQQKKDHYYVIVGALFDEKLYAELNTIINSSSVKDRIIIHEALEHDDFIKLLSEVNLVINSSISEGMSNAIMESMQLGIPVLARRNEGNLKLIDDGKTGIIFSTTEEFTKGYLQMYEDDGFRNRIIKNAKEMIEDKFSMNNEILSYQSLLKEFHQKHYSLLGFNNHQLQLLFSKGVHPFSAENNEIFSKVKLIGGEEINILDVGCGAGIFSLIVMLNNNSVKINEIVLTDIDSSALANAYQNLTYFKHLLQYKKITIIKSDLLRDVPETFFKKFEVILANMPQTPSKEKIRSKFS